MRKWLWTFADAYSNSAQAIIPVITFLGVIIFGTWQSARQQLSDDATHIIYLLFGTCVLLLFLLIATRFAILNRRQNFYTSVSKLIKQGIELRKSRSRYLSTPADFEEFKKANSQIDEWDNRTRQIISDYDPDLIPLINVTTIRGNPVQWIDERNAKLTNLFPKL